MFGFALNMPSVDATCTFSCEFYQFFQIAMFHSQLRRSVFTFLRYYVYNPGKYPYKVR